MKRKYYEAYDDRYSQIHSHQMQWFSSVPTSIVAQVMKAYGITTKHRILELGCGEGRDAFALLENGFRILATDISKGAITFCKQKAPKFQLNFQVLDCVNGTLAARFDFIYAVAVVHMLLLDEDRDAFYKFIGDHLSEDGIALICTMGDGQRQFKSDIGTAFELQERVHTQTGIKLQIAGTSCRVVDFDAFQRELQRNGLSIVEQGITSAEPDFPEMMYAVVKHLP